MWSVSFHTDCNKRGQTSRPVVGAEIQTSCNFEANVITFWVVSTVSSTMSFLNVRIIRLCMIIAISLCLVISIFPYTKIFLTLLHHQIQVQDLQQPNQTNPLNIARYRKAVSSALWLQLTLVAPWYSVGFGD